MLPPDDQDLEREIALLERWAGRLDLERMTSHTVPLQVLLEDLARAGTPEPDRPGLARALELVRGRRCALEVADEQATRRLLAAAANHPRGQGRGLRGVLSAERAQVEALQLAADRLSGVMSRTA